MRNIKVIGWGTYIPETAVNFGNCTRYRTQDKNQIDMAVLACEAALKCADISIKDIDLIISASAVAAQPIPATAVLIHERIAKDMDIPAFDVNSSCTSFITAMDIAANYIELGQYKTILIVSSDICSRGLNPDQKESFELFSDGAAAVAVTGSKGKSSGIIASMQKTFSHGAHSTEIRGGGTLLAGYEYNSDNKAEYLFDMKGKQILSLTVKLLPKVFEEFFDKNSLGFDDIDLVVPHQASKALGMIMDKLKVPEEKYVDWVSEYGNMVSASVPFIFCRQLEEGKIKEGDKVLLCGTAAGLTVNMLLLEV